MVEIITADILRNWLLVHILLLKFLGEVRQYRISRRPDLPPKIIEVLSWKSLHKWKFEPASCTAIDVYDGDIVSVGEDGRYVVTDLVISLFSFVIRFIAL